MIGIAKRKADERKIKNINYVQSTIFDEKLKTESYNVILFFNILYLLHDIPKVIQRINELLKPDGLFISATVCIAKKITFSNILQFLLSKIGIVPNTKNFKISELESLIVNGNFQIIETKNLSNTPPYYFIVAKKIY